MLQAHPPSQDAERPGGVPSHVRQVRLARNLWLLAAFRMLQMSLFAVSIVTLYWRDALGFSMADIFTVQALFGLFTAVLEMPGGYVADRIGYRTSLLIATAFSLVGWIAMALAASFLAVVGAQVLMACSLSLISGTDAAIMYESLLERRREAEFARWYGRSRSLGAAAEGTAALVAGMLFAIAPALPFYVQAGAWAINAVLAWLLIEPARAHGPATGTWARVRGIVHFAAVASPALRASMATVLAMSFATFVPVWMFTIYAEQAGVPTLWLGVTWAAANYAVALGMWSSDRAGDTFGTQRTLVACALLIALGYLGMGLSNTLYGFAFYYAICLARGLNGPVQSHVQQRLIPSSDRAALLSINSALFRAAFFLLGPPLGLAIDRLGQRAVLLGCAAALPPLVLAAIAWQARVARGATPSAGAPPALGAQDR
jgi:MFS family permease